MVLEWHNRSKQRRGHDEAIEIDMSKSRWSFIDNWQTRWYTMQAPCDNLDRPPPHDSHDNYSYWRSGVRIDTRSEIGQKDVEIAKSVLDKFDLLGVTPFFGNGCNMEPWFLLAGSNKPSNTTNDVRNKNQRSKYTNEADIG